MNITLGSLRGDIYSARESYSNYFNCLSIANRIIVIKLMKGVRFCKKTENLQWNTYYLTKTEV